MFCLTGLLVLAVGFFFFDSTMNINVHDTYLILSQTQIALRLAFIFFLISLIYFSFTRFSKSLKYRLGQIHYLITTLALVIFIFPPTNLFQPGQYSPDDHDFGNGLDLNDFLVLVFFGFLLGQLVFLINIFWTLFERKKAKPY